MDVTVIVPTRNESQNVHELVRRLDDVLDDLDAEVLFVDDSDDETPSVIEQVAIASTRLVRLLHREPDSRAGGLGTAVVAGMRSAYAPWAVVLDGDLQHPPELVPALLDRGRTTGADLVYGSRYEDSGDALGLSGRLRLLVSALCTFLAKMLFPRRLAGVSDPMSGFFAVRLDALPLQALRPTGYKILLEILARSNLGRSCGVPYTFQARFAGESKASLREGLRFMLHLLHLRMTVPGGRVVQVAEFLAVGLTGVGVNTAFLWLLTQPQVDVPYLLASVISTNVAIAWNFVLLERFVFRGVRRRSLLGRFSRFWLLNAALLPVQLGLLVTFVEVWGVGPIAANVVVLGIVFVVRYFATLGWVFRWKSTSVSDVVVTSTEEIVTSEPPRRGTTVRTRWQYSLRLVLPVVVTLVAFPGAVVGLVRNGIEGSALATAGVVLLAGAVLLAAYAPPGAGEPEVHDRQLDVILAVPLLGAALWLTLGWADAPSLRGQLDDRTVVAVTLFLAGSAFVLLGTRLAARLRWFLCLPLLYLPWLGQYPLVRTVLLCLVLAGAAFAFTRRRLPRPGGVSGPLAGSGRTQNLPPLHAPMTVVAVIALGLCVIALVPDIAASPTWLTAISGSSSSTSTSAGE